jgi:glutamine synthetase
MPAAAIPAAAIPALLSEKGKALGIKYFLVTFVDLFGASRSKLVPTEAIDEICEDGAGFAGFATNLDMVGF